MATYPTVPPAMMASRSVTASPAPVVGSQRRPCLVPTDPLSDRRLTRGLETAVFHPVAEVEEQADDEPECQPQPVRPPEPVDHRAADDDPKRRDNRNRRDDEAARNVRTAHAHDPDAGAHQHEGEQRAD